MRKLLWLVAMCLSVSSIGCFLDNALRSTALTRTAGSERARQVENDLDWGTMP